MSNILLINEKRSRLDLSSVNDAEGRMIILQPKGAPGSSRECEASVLEHPHVQSVIQAKWARYEAIGVLAQNKPTAESAPPVETTEPPAPAPRAKHEGPVIPPRRPFGAPATTEGEIPEVVATAASEPSALATEEAATNDSTPVVEEAPAEETTTEAVESSESTSTASSEPRRKKRDR